MRLLIVALAVLALAAGRAGAQACYPACRTGYTCQAGACVATAPPREVVVVVPDPPPTRPRYQVEVAAGLASLIAGKRVDRDVMRPAGTVVYGRRGPSIGGRILIREAGNLWLGIHAAYALVSHTRYGETGWNGGDDDGAVVAIEQVFRIPITEPAWGLLVDRKVGLDLSVGGFYGTAGSDLGGCAAARLSFFWLSAGPTIYFGRRTGFGAGLAIGAHAAF